MKKKLFSIFTVIVLFFLCFSKASNAQTNNYSLLINDSYNGAMFIDRFQDGSIEGTIISYGGYKWFKEVYEIKSKKEKTFIQPSKYGIEGNEDSWMLQQYEIGSFNFNYSLSGQDALITFTSIEGIDKIESYISRSKSFSLATLQPSKAWYAATWMPIKNVKQLTYFAKQSPRTFCKVISDIISVDSPNRELGNLPSLLQTKGYKCDSNNNLIDQSTPKTYDPSKVNENKNFKNYWWVVVLLGIGTFFLYTLTVKKPKINFMKKKKSKQRGRIAKYWAGEESLGFSFWGVSTLGIIVMQIPNFILQSKGDAYFDTMPNLLLLAYMLYLIFLLSYIFIAYVGCWRSAGKYIATKIKQKQSAIWGYISYFLIVLSVIRIVTAVIKNI
jgi:hypothetical protein